MSEPVVILHKLRQGTELVAVPPTRKIKRKKRRKNPAMRFDRRKNYWYMKPKVLIPDEPTGDFYGFKNLDQDNFGNFEGFTESDVSLSYVRFLSHDYAEPFDEMHRKSTVVSFPENIESTVVSFPENIESVQKCHILKVIPLKKSKIRVLSLFDGISTGLHVLEELRLDVEIYYSSDIDSAALDIQRELYSGKLIKLGCVKKLNANLLCALGRIDLLLGGSPCNEISLVNWRGKGLWDPESTSHLFFDYVRIRDFLVEQSAKSCCPFFWLYENTSNMKIKTKQSITDALKTQPVLCNGKTFLPNERQRLFWGNLPNMKEKQYSKDNITKLKLQNFLMPGRNATVDIAPTFTSNSSNQLSGAKKLFPVIQDNVFKKLTINEQEQLMGFPMHYTDRADLSITTRRKMLGRAWCVPVVADLLQPLSEMFQVKI